MSYGITIGLTIFGLGVLAGWAARSRFAVESGPVKEGIPQKKPIDFDAPPPYLKSEDRFRKNGKG